MRKNGAQSLESVFVDLGITDGLSTNQGMVGVAQSTGGWVSAQLFASIALDFSTRLVQQIQSVVEMFSTLPTALITTTTFIKRVPKKAVV